MEAQRDQLRDAAADARAMIGIEPSAPALPVRPGHSAPSSTRPPPTKRAEKEIEKIAMAPASPKKNSAAQAAVASLQSVDRIGAHRGDFLSDVEVPPGVHRARRRADLRFPVPQLERRRDAEARDAAALRRRQRSGERRQRCSRRKSRIMLGVG